MASHGRAGAKAGPGPSAVLPEPRDHPGSSAPTSCPRSAASPPQAAGAAWRGGRGARTQPRGVAALGARAAFRDWWFSLRSLMSQPAKFELPLPGSTAANSPPPLSAPPTPRSGQLALKGTRQSGSSRGGPRSGSAPFPAPRPSPPLRPAAPRPRRSIGLLRHRQACAERSRGDRTLQWEQQPCGLGPGGGRPHPRGSRGPALT